MGMIKLSRKALYDEIWQNSAKKVSDKYNLNYQKLLVECKKHNIPLPSNKYWGSFYAGKDVSKLIVPLPVSDSDEILVETAKSKEPDAVVSSVPKEKTKTLFDENTLKDELSFLPEDKLEDIIKKLEKFEIAENKRLHKTVAHYKESVITWHQRVKDADRDYHDPRYMRNDLTEPKFIKNISKEKLPRLYKVLDTIFVILEATGAKILNDLSIAIEEDIIDFEIIESQDKINHELTKAEALEMVKYNDELKRNRYAWKPKIRKYDNIYNGIFRIKTSDGKYIKDNKNTQLEEMIPEIVILFYKAYNYEKIRREEREERDRKREEERIKKEALEDRISNEKRRTRELINIIEDFHIANEIRQYVKVLEKSENGICEEDKNWILSKADWIDPTKSIEDELLGKREHGKDKSEKEDFLKGRRSYW